MQAAFPPLSVSADGSILSVSYFEGALGAYAAAEERRRASAGTPPQASLRLSSASFFEFHFHFLARFCLYLPEIKLTHDNAFSTRKQLLCLKDVKQLVQSKEGFVPQASYLEVCLCRWEPTQYAAAVRSRTLHLATDLLE